MHVCVCVSYIVIVHEPGVVTSQSSGEKLPCFDGCWGQFRATLKEKKKIKFVIYHLIMYHLKLN